MVRKKEKIKAVVFDIGNVLVKASLLKKPKKGHVHGVHEFIANKLNITMDQYFDSIDTAYADSVVGRKTKQETLKIMSKNFGISPQKLEKLYFKSYKKNIKFNKTLIRKAKQLRKKGYKIAILSDQWQVSREVQFPKKLEKIFPLNVISCDVGIRKPNPKIYQLLLKRLNIPAKNVLFIDNQKWNLEPAKKLGMKTILFKDNAQTLNDLEKLGI